MVKIASKVVTALFVLIVVIFGIGTAFKVKDSIFGILREKPITDFSQSIEETMAEGFKSRNNWINVNGLFQRTIGVSIIRDAGDYDVYKLSNGQLTYDYPDCDMKYPANEVESLCNFTQENGMEFVYIQLPCKAYSDDLMPPGTHTYGYADSDELIEQLEKMDVPVLDLRKEIETDGLTVSELFFNTDHHWKPSTALWAAGKIASYLSQTIEGYEFNQGIYNFANYNIKKYREWFLGSLGRRTGIFFGGTDDFEVITPKFETDFHLYTESQSSEGKKKNKDGSFEESLMKMSYLNEKDYFSAMTYFTYLGNEYRLATVTNKRNENDKKILLLRDSFSCTLLPYLSMSAYEITAVDMRYHNELNIKEYIKAHDFDAVLIAYNPSMFREDGAFDFDR